MFILQLAFYVLLELALIIMDLFILVSVRNTHGLEELLVLVSTVLVTVTLTVLVLSDIFEELRLVIFEKKVKSKNLLYRSTDKLKSEYNKIENK